MQEQTNRGLSLQQKEAFIRRALPRLAQHTFPFVSSILGVVDQATGRHFGSALRCRLDGRRAILTAFHVIDAARKDPLGLAISTGYGKPPYIVDGSVNIDPVADLAVYFLPADYPCADEEFFPPSRIDRSRDRLSTDYLFVHGFPGTSGYPSRLLDGIINQSLPYGAMQRLENLPQDLQPWQFAIGYDPVGMANEMGTAADLVDPHGLSGSPVWRIGVSGRTTLEWEPENCLLVGILTQWRPDERVLIATSTEKLPSDW